MLIRLRSLQARLLALLLGLVTVAWLATVVWTWLDVRHELEELLDAHLAQAAALLVVQQTGEFDDDREVESPALHRYAPKVAFQVFHDDRLVLRSSNAIDRAMLAAPDGPLEGFRTVTIDGTAWRVFATHGAERDVQVFVGEQISSRDAILMAVLRSTAAPMLLALPILALAAWWGVRAGLSPLRRLGATLAAREPRSPQPLVVADAPSEMAPMLDALNDLFGRIAVLMDSERRFTADAAHELRTPIAGIRAQAQVAMGATSGPERQHALQSTLQGCDRATRLVEQLLTLSRLEAGTAAAGVVDFCAVVRQVIAELAPRALDKHMAIDLDGCDAGALRGDATLLHVLVRNLVDNAIRYGPEHGRIRIAVTDEPGRLAFTIEDSGPGLSPEARARLGERFFRVSGSRQPGSGLGWSIVRRIADAHRAVIAVDASPTLGGLRAIVGFPKPDR